MIGLFDGLLLRYGVWSLLSKRCCSSTCNIHSIVELGSYVGASGGLQHSEKPAFNRM